MDGDAGRAHDPDSYLIYLICCVSTRICLPVRLMRTPVRRQVTSQPVLPLKEARGLFLARSEGRVGLPSGVADPAGIFFKTWFLPAMKKRGI